MPLIAGKRNCVKRRCANSRRPRSAACPSSRSTRPTASTASIETALGYPGQYPYSRGVHATMYRSRLWTMRQFAGFGTPRQTNERFRFLLDKGQTGLSTAFDLPTLMGLDSDDPRACGEVGRLGVAVDTLDDIGQLFDGIDLEQVSVSMTINAPAIVIMAFFLANAQDQGCDWKQLARHDSERHPQGVPRPERVRLSAGAARAAGGRRDRVLHRSTCRSGTPCRSAATTSARPARRPCRSWPSRWPTASTTSSSAWPAGLTVDAFAPRLSFFFNAHNDLFEEVAKYRAARVLWADIAAESSTAHARSLLEAALPRPDGRLLAAGQAAGGEPDPRGLPGPGRGAGRLSVAAHQQHGRDAGPALGARRHAGPAHAAGAGLRDRRDQHGRSAGRQLLRRDADAADAAGGAGLLRADRPSWAA